MRLGLSEDAHSPARRDGSLITAAAITFCFCAALFYIAPVRTPWDSWFAIHTSYSLLHGHMGDLSAFVSFFPTHHSIGITSGGHPFSTYPIGPSLFALPVTAVADLLIPNLSRLLIQVPTSAELEALTASLWCAVAAVLMMILAARLTGSLPVAVFAAFVFAFCSPVFSTATRALWQHGPVVVSTLAAMLVLQAGERRPALIPLAAAFVALALICRPLIAPLVVLVTVHVSIYHRERLIAFFAAGLIIAALWMAYNYSVWDSVLPPYYRPTAHANVFTDWNGRLLGPLISPSRGLFVFCPIFLFSVVGIVMKLRFRGFDRFDRLYLAVMVCHIVVVALSPAWWAGHSYGPRFMTDIVPVLVYFMLPVLTWIVSAPPTAARGAAVSLLAVTTVVSLLINAQGAFNSETIQWSAKPLNVDSVEGHPRLWDWRDLQFLRSTGPQNAHPVVSLFQLIQHEYALRRSGP